MTTSPSSSDDSGTEDSVSDCKSDQSLSTGYFPTENTFSYGEMASYGEMVSCEEMTASGKPSLHLLPPNQGSWGTGSVRRLFRKQDQMKEEQFCKLSISLAWDTNVSSDQADALANLDPNGQWQWMERWPKDRAKLTPCKLDSLVQKLETFLEKEKDSQHDSPLCPESTQKEDVHLTSVPPPHTAWVRHDKHGICQDLPKHKTPKTKDSCQAPENSPRLREDEVMVSTEKPPRRAGGRTGGERTDSGASLPGSPRRHQPGLERGWGCRKDTKEYGGRDEGRNSK